MTPQEAMTLLFRGCRFDPRCDAVRMLGLGIGVFTPLFIAVAPWDRPNAPYRLSAWGIEYLDGLYDGDPVDSRLFFDGSRALFEQLRTERQILEAQ